MDLLPIEGRLSGDNRRPSGSRKNATTYAKIREAHTVEEKLRAHEERRLRRASPGRLAEYAEADSRKCIRVYGELLQWGSRERRSVSPLNCDAQPATSGKSAGFHRGYE